MNHSKKENRICAHVHTQSKSNWQHSSVASGAFYLLILLFKTFTIRTEMPKWKSCKWHPFLISAGFPPLKSGFSVGCKKYLIRLCHSYSLMTI